MFMKRFVSCWLISPASLFSVTAKFKLFIKTEDLMLRARMYWGKLYFYVSLSCLVIDVVINSVHLPNENLSLNLLKPHIQLNPNYLISSTKAFYKTKNIEFAHRASSKFAAYISVILLQVSAATNVELLQR